MGEVERGPVPPPIERVGQHGRPAAAAAVAAGAAAVERGEGEGETPPDGFRPEIDSWILSTGKIVQLKKSKPLGALRNIK